MIVVCCLLLLVFACKIIDCKITTGWLILSQLFILIYATIHLKPPLMLFYGQMYCTAIRLMSDKSIIR